MAAPDTVPTTNRQWALDVDVSATEIPNWVPVRGLTNFVPQQSDTMADDTDYDDGIWTSMGVQARSFAPTATVRRNVDDSLAFDPGQEALRAAADSADPAHIRYYNRATPLGEAFEGMVQVGWSPTGGAGPGWQEVGLTLTGRGERKTIAHPGTDPAPVPVITSAAPAGAAAGDQVTLRGGGFTGATDVTFGGVSSTEFTVVDSGTIVAVLPAGTAGVANVVVTTPGGVSASFDYTRG